jgi:hypothetical protein
VSQNCMDTLCVMNRGRNCVGRNTPWLMLPPGCVEVLLDGFGRGGGPTRGRDRCRNTYSGGEYNQQSKVECQPSGRKRTHYPEVLEML